MTPRLKLCVASLAAFALAAGAAPALAGGEGGVGWISPPHGPHAPVSCPATATYLVYLNGACAGQVAQVVFADQRVTLNFAGTLPYPIADWVFSTGGKTVDIQIYARGAGRTCTKRDYPQALPSRPLSGDSQGGGSVQFSYNRLGQPPPKPC